MAEQAKVETVERTTLKVVQQNGNLDPVSLGELAEAMAERKLVDMRVVPGGIAERVRIVALLIRFDEEEVQIEQELQDETGDISRHRHWLNAEEIWWIRPTSFEAKDLEVVTPFCPKGKLQSKDNAYEAACAAVAHWSRVSPGEVDHIAKHRLDQNHYRYWVMLVYKELTDAPPTEVTGLFGYASIQPLVSARDHAKNNNGDVRLEAMVKHAKGIMP